MKELKFSISGLINIITFILYLLMFGIIGYSLPTTINKINGFEINFWYGKFASYLVSCILFWVLMKDHKFKKIFYKKNVR